MNIFKELPTAFPWYDKVENQHRHGEHIRGRIQDWGLISPRNGLLPFEFWNATGSAPASWQIVTLDGTLVATIDAASLALIRQAGPFSGRNYYYYAGEALATAGGPLNLAEGFYYSKITMADAAVFYSEVFHVPACSFVVDEINNLEFLKLEWYNPSDIAPIFYNDLDGGGIPFFRNVVYLDTFIHTSDPEIEEDGIKDGNDEVVPTFQKAILRQRITDMVPDFLFTALVVMQMHDTVIITNRKGRRIGSPSRITVTNAGKDVNGAFTTVDIIFEDDLAMIKKGCADNMA